jgi:predicted GNAT superfamily acetyltransferase
MSEKAGVLDGGDAIARRESEAHRPEVAASDPDSNLDLDLRELCSLGQLSEAAGLLWRVWGADSGAAKSEVIRLSFLRALSHSGNYVSGAYLGGRLVGCTVGWLGIDLAGPGRSDHLHSHISGVDRSVRDLGVGFALKAHQRQWALDRGITRIRWTFDPLIRRNAYFCLCKLGVTVRGYEPDFYGDLDDGINTGEATDRLLIEWVLDSPTVVEAMSGRPVTTPERARCRRDAELIWIPRDAEVPGGKGGDRNSDLRLSVRARFLDLLELGYHVAGMTRDGNYVLLLDGMSELADV